MSETDPLVGYRKIHGIALASLEMQITQLELKLLLSNRAQTVVRIQQLISLLLDELSEQEERLVSVVEDFSDEMMSEVSDVTKVFNSVLPQIPADTTSTKRLVASFPHEVSALLREDEENKVSELRKLFAELRAKVMVLKKRLDAL